MDTVESVNVETLRQVLDAFNRHDLDTIMSFFADDFELEMSRCSQSVSANESPVSPHHPL